MDPEERRQSLEKMIARAAHSAAARDGLIAMLDFAICNAPGPANRPRGFSVKLMRELHKYVSEQVGIRADPENPKPLGREKSKARVTFLEDAIAQFATENELDTRTVWRAFLENPEFAQLRGSIDLLPRKPRRIK
jgi:hypothetical protein